MPKFDETWCPGKQYQRIWRNYLCFIYSVSRYNCGIILCQYRNIIYTMYQNIWSLSGLLFVGLCFLFKKCLFWRSSAHLLLYCISEINLQIILTLVLWYKLEAEGNIMFFITILLCMGLKVNLDIHRMGLHTQQH